MKENPIIKFDGRYIIPEEHLAVPFGEVKEAALRCIQEMMSAKSELLKLKKELEAKSDEVKKTKERAWLIVKRTDLRYYVSIDGPSERITFLENGVVWELVNNKGNIDVIKRPLVE